jgi:hypothetical protein
VPSRLPPSRSALWRTNRAFVIVMGLACAGAEGLTQGPSPILLEQRQREVALVRHLRQHVADPADGLALAADRRDLQRLRSGTPQTATALPSPSATNDELVDSLRILADVWYVRLVERTPFGLMPRERLAGLTAAQRAVGQLQSRGGRSGLDVWLPEVQDELNAVVRAASGQGEVSDPAIDMALSVADAAASGRPSIGPAWSPAAPGTGARSPETYSGSGPGGPPPGVFYPGSPAPLPPSGGPTPYTLPPGYEAYSGAAAAGAGGIAACQTLRTAAGVSQSISDMVRAAECWTRTPTWPGWGAQALEALDWATNLAAIERNCTALTTAIDSLRELGPRLSAGGLTPEVTAVARRAQTDHRRLRGQSLCR